MNYKITSFSGFFYVSCPKTGKLLISESFRSYKDADSAGKRLILIV